MATEKQLSIDSVIEAATTTTGIPNYPRDRIDRYRTAVNTLIENARGWLAPQIDAKRVKVYPIQEVDRFEQGHSYKVNSWSFGLGNIYVSLEPRGTWVIGALGRVDLVAAPGDTVVLTLNSEFNWELPTKGRTRITYEPLNEDTFAKAMHRAFQKAS